MEVWLQAVECLLFKRKTLTSNPRPTKKTPKKTKKQKIPTTWEAKAGRSKVQGLYISVSCWFYFSAEP
jgi:hypothetical protein